MRFAYADPPYPGRGGLYPEGEEVDHARLIARLVAQFPDGWALSTAADALQHVLGLCPAGVRVGAWTRQARRAKSRRPVSGWEPLIICGGRELATDRPQRVLDVMIEADVEERALSTALVHHGRHRSYPGALIGMKPPAFAVWLFSQLGARPGDELADLYPGSGAITRAWQHYTSPAGGADASDSPARAAGAGR